ncbi:hypothetical protein RJ639_016475 [Escallonia herrerae]|uniref:RNase H type-1 domain-containing protein n=1 Tax=Escallonia herrerae TaxID=1293975 RepID=A0AA88VEF4_9ASTE|nr:hypothetical protein RJ639_016475 [Escallonia herrerae]
MQMGEPVKDLLNIEVYPGEKVKTVRICSNLKKDNKLELVNLLRTYADIFAWTVVDMPGIDPEVITYRLNADSSKKPIKQNKRTFAPERQEKIEEKVDKLLTSNFIEEIYYPDWIANVVMVLKLCGRWRISSNNEVEYEALLTGIRLAHALKVDSLSVHSDSLLVVNYVLGDYEARDERMTQYFQLVKTLASKFKKLHHSLNSSRSNTQADTLSRLASAKVTDVQPSVYLELLIERNISSQTEIGVIDEEPCWMDPIIKYLSMGELPGGKHEACNLCIKVARYKRSFCLPYLRCLHPSESLNALQEVHEGICGQHLGGRILAQKILRQGYY